jgi:hypothetical protein
VIFRRKTEVWLSIYIYRKRRFGHPRRILTQFRRLEPGKVIHVTDTALTIGHAADLVIDYFDQNGNPMLTTPTTDSANWSNSAPSICTLTPSVDGFSAVEMAVAAGSDLVTLAVTVGGVVFTATAGFLISPEPQVLSSIGIGITVK